MIIIMSVRPVKLSTTFSGNEQPFEGRGRRTHLVDVRRGTSTTWGADGLTSKASNVDVPRSPAMPLVYGHIRYRGTVLMKLCVAMTRLPSAPADAALSAAVRTGR